MSPDFNKSTTETLGKRAAYICSNPDCRVHTIGPDSDKEKSIKIGEAAHIYGARQGAKRFDPQMTDAARSEITNAIWLCRNCHKLIDTDDQRFSPTVLFKWREIHEAYITAKLGSSTDKLVHAELVASIEEFEGYNPIIKRIIIDKPMGWEFSLTAALMRHLYKPLVIRLNDLKNGLYLKEMSFIEKKEAFTWLQNRLSEMARLVRPCKALVESLSKSWGEPGVSGNVNEIHHVVKLIQSYLEQVVKFEERLIFTVLPEEFNGLVNLLKDIIGSQAEKLTMIPEYLDDILIMMENLDPESDEKITIHKTISFELPADWQEQFNLELSAIKNPYI